MLLEGLFGGGNNSSPPSNTQTQPTPPPSSSPQPEPSTGTGTAAPAEDETADDDMPIHHDDGTYSPEPVTDATDHSPANGSAETPTDEAAGSQPVSPDRNEEAEAPAQPVPGGNHTSVAPAQPDVAVDDVASTPAASIKADPVARITDLIASYEKLLSEPAANEDEEARTRAMELAQNRVLTSLIGNLSTSDAHAVRTPLNDDTGTDQVSLITRYYAEAGR